ncbi:MAG: class I SAM-dependent methyltransferase [Candidatus Bathyarchaeia archaeon]
MEDARASEERRGKWEEKESIAERYDRLSSSYDELYGEEQRRKYDLALWTMRGASGLALDLGCGTGTLFSRLIGSFEIVGVDISKGMLNAARRRGLKAHLIRADAEYLPLKDRIFDAIFCFTVFSGPADLRASIPELARVLKPFATLVLSAPKEGFEPMELVEALEPLGECELIDPGIGDYVCICRLSGRRGGTSPAPPPRGGQISDQ